MIKVLSFLACLSLVLVLVTNVSANQDGHTQPTIPERNGDYADPEHPGVRVRVFVHEAKGPQPITLSPVLACTDPDSSAVVGPTGWKLPNGSWTYQLNVGSVPSSVGVGSTNFPTLAGNAFNAWQSAVSSKVTFTRGSDTTANKQALDWRNIVSWGRTSGTALAVTYTRYYTATGIVADVDTIMNQKFPWSWTDPVNQCSLYSNTYDSQDILTHEIGHWMGLNDQKASEYQHNTMFWSGTTGELKKNTLTTGDRDGVTAIYP